MKDLLLEFLKDILDEAPNPKIASSKGGPSKTKSKSTEPSLRPGESKEFPGYFHRGGGYYSKSADGQITHKNDDGTIVQLSAKEKREKNAAAQPQQPTSRRTTTTQQTRPSRVTSRTSRGREASRDATETAKMSEEEQEQLFGYLDNPRLRGFRAASLARLDAIAADRNLSPEQQKQLEDLNAGLREVLSLYSAGDLETARIIATQLHEEFKFFSNSTGRSFKTVIFGQRHRHIVGTGASSPTSTNLAGELVQIFDELGIDLRKAEEGDKRYKNEMSAASKGAPSGGFQAGFDRKDGKGKNARTIPADPVVRKLFSPLRNIPEEYHAVFGPVDPKTGHLLDNTGGKNSREYFSHSLESDTSLERITEVFRKYNIPRGVELVDAHRARMQEILDNWDNYTPEERQKMVQESFATLAVELFKMDPEGCSAILKNVAEQSLYQQELANNEEVYLPAAGTFPGADKLIRKGSGTKGERISGISVKWGKSGLVFGMPAQSNTLMMWHDDAFYAGMTDLRPGKEGHETGIRSDALEADSWNRLMNDSEYSTALPKEDREVLRKAFKAFETCVKNQKKGKKSSNLLIIDTWAQCTGENQSHMKIINEILERNMDKLTKLLGEENAGLLQKKPEAFPQLLAFHSALRTSNGLSNLSHNHQRVSRAGRDAPVEFESETEDGSPEYRYWHCQFRVGDLRGGGLICGFSREVRGASKE